MSIAWSPPRIAFPAVPRRKTARPVPSPSSLEMAEAQRELRESKRRLAAARAQRIEAERLCAELRRLMEKL